jgi:DNA-binding transcriptional MerR regulator
MHLDKAPDAFRTISEVADDLDVPQHVLRFWETRFSQIKPMKRSGGRRYYRPDDVALLRGIRRLLYGEGYTIRGVQRILREHGVKSVQSLTDAPDRAPALFDGVAQDAEPGDHHALEDIDGTEDADIHVEDEGDEDDVLNEQPATRSAPVLSSLSPLHDRGVPLSAAAAVHGPVLPSPVVAKPVYPSPLNGGPSGAEAYAPPSIRKNARPTDRGKLQAALDDLIGARALIDEVLKES